MFYPYHDFKPYMEFYIEHYYKIRSFFLELDMSTIPFLSNFDFSLTMHDRYTAWIEGLEDIDWLPIITGNDINPIFFGMEFFIEWANLLTGIFLDVGSSIGFELSETPDSDDPFYEMYVNMELPEIYEGYWRQLVYTASPMVEWIKYIWGNYNPMNIISGIYSKCIVTILGFEPECPGIQAGMQVKLLNLALLLPQWIGLLLAIIIRIVSLIGYTIFYFIQWIIDMFMEIIIQIHVTIYYNIYLPIYEALLPIIEIFVQIKLFIIDILMILPNLLIWIWWFIMDIVWNIQWFIIQIGLIIYDFIWSILWLIVGFIWTILWPVIEILMFIPDLLLDLWYQLMELIFMPLDGFCVDIFLWLEENIVDPILEALQAPEWTPSWFELAVSVPIILATVE